MADTIEVRDMAIVHATFRRTFEESADLVRESTGASAERVRFLTEHVDFGLRQLHHHHEAEDRILFPLLRERVPEHAGLLERISSQHDDVAACIERSERALGAWASRQDDGTRSELADSLDDLTAALVAHLDQEEADVVPLGAVHLTQAEWDRMGDEARRAIPRDRLFTAFGALLEPLSDDDQAYMLGHLPAPARLLWRLVGRRSYERYRQRLMAGV